MLGSPAARIVLTCNIDTHHDVLRFSWKRINQHKSVVVEGIDVAVIEGGKIGRMVGFFWGVGMILSNSVYRPNDCTGAISEMRKT